MGRVCGPAADNNTEELIGGKPSHSGEYDEDMQDDKGILYVCTEWRCIQRLHRMDRR